MGTSCRTSICMSSKFSEPLCMVLWSHVPTHMVRCCCPSTSTVCLSPVFRDFCNCSSSLLVFIVTQEVVTAWISLLTHLLVYHLFYSAPLACLTQVKVECATERAMQEWWRMARLLQWIGKDEKVRMREGGCRQRRQAAVAGTAECKEC